MNAGCVDHKSTPAQYALAERPEICRRLLERGASADIFMPARLGDVALAMRVLDADSVAIAARINEPGYAPVPPLHIYCWTLGFGLSPHDVALKFGHRDVYDLLVSRSPAHVRFINTVLAGDEAGAYARAFLIGGVIIPIFLHMIASESMPWWPDTVSMGIALERLLSPSSGRIERIERRGGACGMR